MHQYTAAVIPCVRRTAAITTVALLLSLRAVAAAPPADKTEGYVIGAQDVVSVLVYDQPTLSGKFSVEQDGTINYPLLGRVKAAGLTARALENEVRDGLADGYLKKPQITVSIEQYRSQQFFIVGDVRVPGPYPLTGDTSLLEALARAGVGTSSPEAIVVRSANTTGPVLPGDADATEVIKVPLKALQTGDLSRNITLKDGDTIFIPKPDAMLFVFGQVRSPGSYALQEHMTVLQALALAGGVAPGGAMGRIKIMRVVDGKNKEIKAKLNDPVQAGDTIIVPERYF